MWTFLLLRLLTVLLGTLRLWLEKTLIFWKKLNMDTFWINSMSLLQLFFKENEAMCPMSLGETSALCGKTVWRAPFSHTRGNRKSLFPGPYPGVRVLNASALWESHQCCTKFKDLKQHTSENLTACILFSLTRCVTLGKLLGLSDSLFSYM